jgi:uncharacterized membrane protein YfcA
MLTTLQQVIAGLAGLGGGVLSGFFGVGGNVILVPLLAVTLGLNQQQAQGLTLAALLPPLGLPAVLEYRKSGVPILWPLVGVIILGFLPAIPLGSLLANVLPANALRLMFAGILVFNAVRTWRTKQPTTPQPLLHEPPKGYVPVSLLAGATAGLASGLLGIGGAIVLIPLLTRRLGLSQRQAQLTSLAMLLPPIALPGVWVYARSQQGLPWGALLPIAGGFLIGSFAGAKLARVVSAARLTRGFAVLLGVSAVALVVTALR